MFAAPLADLAVPLAAELRGVSAGAAAAGVSTDSRNCPPGALFFALRGERFDGHDFVPAAQTAGAAAVVVARTHAGRTAGPRLVVDDPRAALGRLAAWWRARFDLPVIGVAGSNGKTTTKELLAAVLGARFEVLASEASFNNDIGVPLTLLRLGPGQGAAVLELGTNHPGELAPLVSLARPSLGVLTHIGEEHLQFFGSVAGVAEEEGWLAELLPADGTLYLPDTGAWWPGVIARAAACIVRVGRTPAAGWRVLRTEADARGTTFEVAAPMPALSGTYRVNLLGAHQVTNALLALAVGGRLGLGREELQRGLAACPPPRLRLQAWEHAGVRVLDDCYNANPDSMLAALATLAEQPAAGRRIAVLGPMAELGPAAAEAHVRVGRAAGAAGGAKTLESPLNPSDLKPRTKRA
ncbi:MAG TPA: UDP-N-acetylmuramoyl-tripeptide--D-alanyl-D-alanine ligase [Verrucomicrobiota bacterium]|nr:UDP-N-acetylmuramoyl-tripeptide--D-alanyl-D-alanine ligase [Verrucomicrobiota bacterium]